MSDIFLTRDDDADAIPLCLRVLAIRRKWLKPDDPAITKLLGELANLAHNQTNLHDAELCYTEQLAIFQNSTNTSELASAEWNLGSIKEEKGDLKSAEVHFRNALNIEQSISGTNALFPVASLQRLANILEMETNFPEGEIYDRQYLSTVADDFPDIWTIPYNL